MVEAGRPRRSGPRARCRIAGFTLVEVLVALSILAIALAAVLRTVGQAGYTSIALNDRAQALWVAQDHMTRLQIVRAWPEPRTSTGTTQWGGREWRWREQVVTTPNLGIRRIEIEVRSADDRESLARVAGYLRKPPP
ncbi:MAG TPA: type II secretion system minor pseudopilin GspI [Acidiferrobacterales bacterium]|jgi:general secretion pathway protein I